MQIKKKTSTRSAADRCNLIEYMPMDISLFRESMKLFIRDVPLIPLLILAFSLIFFCFVSFIRLMKIPTKFPTSIPANRALSMVIQLQNVIREKTELSWRSYKRIPPKINIASVLVIAYSKFVRILSNLPERFLRFCFWFGKCVCIPSTRPHSRFELSEKFNIRFLFVLADYRSYMQYSRYVFIYSFIPVDDTPQCRNANCICLYGQALIAEAENGHFRYWETVLCSWCTTFLGDYDILSEITRKQSALVSRNVYFIFSSLSPNYISSILVPLIVSFVFARASLASCSHGTCHNFLKLIPWLARHRSDFEIFETFEHLARASEYQILIINATTVTAIMVYRNYSHLCWDTIFSDNTNPRLTIHLY